MRVYYNEFDPKAAAWLRVLMADGLIPKGEVDERSIADVRGSDLAGYDQCHFFAGIGGWAEALRLARWEGPVWTGSCPCQPFSAAGKGKGVKDKRHLWPDLRRLIAECSPAVCFGEQVASKAGREWLSGVRTDLEALAYAVGSADLCAAGAGAPHIRQRLWWVAESDGGLAGDGGIQRSGEYGQFAQDGGPLRMADAGHEREGWPARSGEAEGRRPFRELAGCGNDCHHCKSTGSFPNGNKCYCCNGRGWRDPVRVGNPDLARSQGRREHPGEHADQRVARSAGEPGGVDDAMRAGWPEGRPEGRPESGDGQAAGTSASRRLAVTDDSERRANESTGDQRDGSATGRNEGNRNAQEHRGTGYWSAFDLVHCTDGKARRIEPGTFPLAHGIPARVGRLRGYGNAISPQIAAEFIAAYMDARN